MQKRKLNAQGGAPPQMATAGLPSPMPPAQTPAAAGDPSAAVNPQNAGIYLGEGGMDAMQPHPDLAQLLQLLQGRR